MERFFNNAGPTKPDLHDHIDPLSRVDWEDVQTLIRGSSDTPAVSWEARIWHAECQHAGRHIGVWGA